MELEIDSSEAAELAAELAVLTGESVEEAVLTAIRERLEREKLVADLMDIARQCASRPRRDDSSLEDFLYDERGLPR